MNNDFLKNIDLQKIAEEGAKIYQKIKSQYEPRENGKFLAIEIESEKAYLSDDGAEALILARKNHPDKAFHLVRIGYDYVDRFASGFILPHWK